VDQPQRWHQPTVGHRGDRSGLGVVHGDDVGATRFSALSSHGDGEERDDAVAAFLASDLASVAINDHVHDATTDV